MDGWTSFETFCNRNIHTEKGTVIRDVGDVLGTRFDEIGDLTSFYDEHGTEDEWEINPDDDPERYRRLVNMKKQHFLAALRPFFDESVAVEELAKNFEEVLDWEMLDEHHPDLEETIKAWIGPERVRDVENFM